MNLKEALEASNCGKVKDYLEHVLTDEELKEVPYWRSIMSVWLPIIENIGE